MDIKFAIDENLREDFYVGPRFNLNEHRYLQAPDDFAKDKTFGCCCWESDPLKLVTKLPCKGFVPGELIKVQIEVNNESDVDIELMEVKLKEEITFWSQTPSQKSREKERDLWRRDIIKDGLLVQKFQKKIFDAEIFLDPSYDFKVFNNCSIILVQYFIKVNAIPRGCCHTRLSNSLQITIGTIPFDNLPYTVPDAITETPLAPYPFPSAPNADFASAPLLSTVTEQPLPNYHDAVYNPPKPSVLSESEANNLVGWNVPNETEMRKSIDKLYLRDCI